MRPGAGVPEPGFDVEGEVPADGTTGCRRPLIVLAGQGMRSRAVLTLIPALMGAVALTALAGRRAGTSSPGRLHATQR